MFSSVFKHFSQALVHSLRALRGICFPIRCMNCGESSSGDHPVLCPACYVNLPFTDFIPGTEHPMERMLWGKFPIEKAYAWIYYDKATPTTHLLQYVKYRGLTNRIQQIAYEACEIPYHNAFFEGITAIIPIPLSKISKRRRRYNPAEQIAIGLAHRTGIIVRTDVVYRKIHTTSQTKVSPLLRSENIAHAFAAHFSQTLVGAHILLVDDVMTTGSTLTTCARALMTIGVKRISVFTLAVSAKIPNGSIPHPSEQCLTLS